MRVLLIHQNFPGQFKHLGPALVARGDHVVALTPKVKERTEWRGITVEPYAIKRGNGQGCASLGHRFRNQGHPR